MSTDRHAAVAVELAVLAPIFLFLLFSIISYGGYFWLSTTVQQLANDAARASIAGLNTTERQSLAQTQVSEEIQTYKYLSTTLLTTNVATQTDSMTITVSYDASKTPFWAFSGFIPMPSSTISRSATIKLAGY